MYQFFILCLLFSFTMQLSKYQQYCILYSFYLFANAFGKRHLKSPNAFKHTLFAFPFCNILNAIQNVLQKSLCKESSLSFKNNLAISEKFLKQSEDYLETFVINLFIFASSKTHSDILFCNLTQVKEEIRGFITNRKYI